MLRFKYLVLMFIILLPAQVLAEAGIKLTSNNEIVSWHKETLTICNQISNKDIKNINTYLQLSIDTWNNSHISPTITIANNNCDITVNYNLVTIDPSPLAITKLTYNNDTGEIYYAEIIINNKYDSEIGNGNNKKLYDVPSFLAHEIGHALGLNEDLEDSESTMYYATKRGTTYKGDLNQSDLNAISKIYSNGKSIQQINDQQVNNYGSCSFNKNKNYNYVIVILFIIMLMVRTSNHRQL